MYLSLGRLLLNHKTSQVINLINKEDSDYNFHIIPESCYSEGKQSSLTIIPATGKVMKNSKLPLTITYEAKHPGESTFNVLVNSINFSKPISLKVKIESHKMNAKLVYEPSVDTLAVMNPSPKQLAILTQGSNMSLNSQLSSSPSNVTAGKSITGQLTNNFENVVLQEYPYVNKLHFGTMQLNEKSIVKFSLKNIGKFPFDFEWQKVNGSKTISVSHNQSGIVNCDSFKQSIIEYQPKSVGTLMPTELKLKIAYGATYLLSLTGKCIEPALSLSFKSYDFGSRFIYRPGMQINSVCLTLVNHDNIDISVEITNPTVPWLEIDFSPTVLPPGESTGITIIFTPERAQKYIETLNILVNGLSKKSVVITGRGCEMKLDTFELLPQKLSSMIEQQVGKISTGKETHRDRLRESFKSNWKVGKMIRSIKLGAILPKQQVVKRIRLVNNSACELLGQVALSGPTEPSLDGGSKRP